jgi:acyl-CoA synthetase (AMP-forming)/AMP-acid ligase II/acyl carrier protein
MDCTPVIVEQWFEAGLDKQLPNLIIGGDAISQSLWEKLVAWQQATGKKVLNVYGPTEASVNTTYAEIIGPYPTIGRGLKNTNLAVLDNHLQLVPQGVAGELHIGGVGLARGYLNQADLTAMRFIANPFYDETKKEGLHTKKRLYKTGDLVRWLPNGTLEFLGRIDHQVKIRGFRIELGEIAHQLASQNSVNDAIVLAKTNEQGDKQLVAYVVTPLANSFTEDTEQSQQERADYIDGLRQALLTTLPDYMVPAAFVLLDSFPITSNGKVDRKALPDADVFSQQIYVAPTTDTEQALCEIWQDLLKIERVGVNDDFFALGGHSLQIMKLLSAIRARFTIEVSVAQLFELKKISDCATHIDNLNVVKLMSQSNKNNNVKEEGLL